MLGLAWPCATCCAELPIVIGFLFSTLSYVLQILRSSVGTILFPVSVERLRPSDLFQ